MFLASQALIWRSTLTWCSNNLSPSLTGRTRPRLFKKILVNIFVLFILSLSGVVKKRGYLFLFQVSFYYHGQWIFSNSPLHFGSYCFWQSINLSLDFFSLHFGTLYLQSNFQLTMTLFYMWSLQVKYGESHISYSFVACLIIRRSF